MRMLVDVDDAAADCEQRRELDTSKDQEVRVLGTLASTCKTILPIGSRGSQTSAVPDSS